MISTSELRIRNYINYNDGSGIDDIRQVIGIESDGVTAVIKLCKFAIAYRSSFDIYAIPLTEEILLKCGFEKDEYE